MFEVFEAKIIVFTESKQADKKFLPKEFLLILYILKSISQYDV